MAPFPSMAPPEHVTVPPSSNPAPHPQPQPTRIEVPIGVPAYHLYQPPPVYKPLRPIRGLGNAAITLAVIFQLAGLAGTVYVQANRSSLEATLLPLVTDPTIFADPALADRPELRTFLDASMPLLACLALTVLSCVLCMFVFVWWMFRARANAEALAPFEHRRHKAWIVFGWLIPVLDLWFPKQIIDDIWQTSDPSIRHRDPMMRTRSRPIVVVWWTLWLVFWAGLLLAIFAGFEPALQLQVQVGVTIVSVVGTVLGSIIVWAISTLQDDQRERKLVDSVQ